MELKVSSWKNLSLFHIECNHKICYFYMQINVHIFQGTYTLFANKKMTIEKDKQLNL